MGCHSRHLSKNGKLADASEIAHLSSRFKVQGSLLFVTYIIIQGIIGSEMLIRTGPLNGKCKKKKKKKKHNNNIKAIKTMKQNTREYIYIQIW